jgi:hypothetical protein
LIVCLVTLRGRRLDDIRIDRSLREPLHAPHLGRLALEHVDEQSADDLALLLGIVDPGECPEEFVARIDVNDPHAEVTRERVHHLLGFVLPQQPVVHEHAGQPLADRAMQQCSGDGGIDTAGQTEQHLLIAHLPANRLDRLRGVVVHVPVVAAAADLVREAGEQHRALLRVRDFGMELDTVESARFVRHRSDRAGARRAGDDEPRRQPDHLVAVAHPDVEQSVALAVAPILDAVEQCRMAARTHFRVAELAHPRRFDGTAQLRGHRLHAIADAQDGDAQLPYR